MIDVSNMFSRSLCQKYISQNLFLISKCVCCECLTKRTIYIPFYIPVLHICSNKLLAFSPMIRTSRFIYAFTFSHNLVKATYFFLIFSLFSSYFEPGGCSYCSSVLPDCRPTRACQYRQISEKEISFTEASVICVTTLKMS